MRFQDSLKGRKRLGSMLHLGVMGVLSLVISGNVSAVWAQTGATNIAIGTTVQQPAVKRLGINLGGQLYYDSAQMLRDITFNNPGFEGQQWRSVITCTQVSKNTCTDGNGWSQWPANFLQGGSFNFIYGKANGQTGTLVSMTASSANGGSGSWYNFGNVTPAVGDIFVISKEMPGDPDAGWWPTTSGGGKVYAETTDLSPNSPGKQALVMDANGNNERVYEYSYFDSTAGHSFLQLKGTYTIKFRAKAVAGSNTLFVNVGRFTSTHGISSYFSQPIALTNQWQDYSYTFTAHEDGTYIGTAFLSFETLGGKVYLDDASMTESAGPNNPTPFRDAVLTRLQQLNPGVLRYMDSGVDFGTTIDNQIAVPEARERTGFGQGSSLTNAVPMGLEEFLVLCQAINAEPWFTMPMGMSPTEMQNLIQFLAGDASTPYGAKRAALGQAAPWTSVFPSIHLELGDEAWNTAFSGDTIQSPNAYGSRIATIFGAARSAPGYDPTKFDLVMDGWNAVPWWSQTAMNNANNMYDTIDAAPYTFDTFTDYSSNEAIFGSMFAQPEAMDSRSNGIMYQQMQTVNGKASGLTGKPANLAIYEVNLGTTSGTASQGVLNQVIPSLGAGLSTAEHMLLMMRDDNVTYQAMFTLSGYINGFSNDKGGGSDVPIWGTVVDMGGATNASRPQLLAEQLANTAIGGSLLATVQTGANPTWDENSKNDIYDPIVIKGAHYLQTFAFTNGTQNSLILFNLSRTSALPVTFSGVNAPYGTVQVGLLTSANLTDNNESGQKIAIANSTLHNFDPSATTSLPPYSMTVYTWSTSGGVTTPQPVTTTTGLTATPTSITAGQSVAITAAVAAAPGSTVPSGTVILADNGNTIGTTTLNNGIVSLSTSTLAVGTHALTASYLGSTSFSSSIAPAVSVTVAAAPLVATSTAVVAPSQVVAGQPASLAATVAASSGSTPTGTTTFFVGSTKLGAATLSSGKATLAIPAVNMAAGTYAVVANYGGSSVNSPSTSTAATLVVSAATTTTTLVAPAQVTTGQSATFTASVKAASGAVATGSVAFSAGSTSLGTGTLSNGQVTLTVPALSLTAGSYAVSATYAGNSVDSTSTSASAMMTVVSPVIATTTTVSAPSQVTNGSAATFTAAVSAASGASPTGTVTFSAGSTSLGSGTLSGGKATLTVSAINLPVGTSAVTASYAGTTTHSASTSAAVTLTVVNPVIATTTTVSAPSQVTTGTAATFTAAVTPASGTSPTGTVTFSAGSTSLGSGTLSSGKATLTVPAISLPAGTYAVTASYAGTTTNSASTSAAVTLTVVNPVIATTTTGTAPSQVTNGKSATFTATVTAASGGTPTGTVTFAAGSISLGTGTLSNGKARLIVPSISLPVGIDAITATYNGAGSDSASTSGPLNMKVLAAPVATTTTINISATQLSMGQTVTATINVTTATGATPTGSVKLYLGPLLLDTIKLTNGAATYSTVVTGPLGSYSAYAAYGGSSADAPSKSTPFTITISPAAAVTATSLTSSTLETVQGTPVRLIASVLPPGKGVTAAGAVTFYLGSKSVGTAQLADNKASFTLNTTVAPRQYQLSAAYAGNATDLGSTSNTLTLTLTAMQRRPVHSFLLL